VADMRYLLIIAFAFMFFVQNCFAQGTADRLSQAESAYKNAAYDDAVQLYKALIDEGYHDARLYNNLGNALFKQGKLGESILQYERAFLLEPGDSEILHNLNVTRARIRDRVEAIPLLFIVRWWNDVKTYNSVETLFVFSAILLWVLAVCVFVFFGIQRLILRRIALAIGTLVAVVFIASLVMVQDKNEDLTAKRYGIILPIEVSVASAPDRSGVESFIVHEGLKVEVLQQNDERIQIRLADGKQGWIDHQELARI
jgi:tetratricopeptide (TPR) repeat protein